MLRPILTRKRRYVSSETRKMRITENIELSSNSEREKEKMKNNYKTLSSRNTSEVKEAD